MGKEFASESARDSTTKTRLEGCCFHVFSILKSGATGPLKTRGPDGFWSALK